MKKPELLVPAGNLAKLKIGLQYGADAFYLGMPSFSMRSRINNFTEGSLLEGVNLIREAGKTLYVTMNIYPRGNKVDAFVKHIKYIREKIKPDALIVADPGVMELIKEHYPEAVIHMSVQANILNYRAVDFWHKQGAERIILPRELMLKEIQEIHEKVPEVELETFVHGAICMAYSGRCLLSNYMTGRDSNQGICAHSCRWKYRLHNDESMKERVEELKEKADQEEDQILLEEEKRPGEFMATEEDEHGTYIMNSKDMCMLPHLKELYDAGVCSFKVEGRNKTVHYLSTVVKAYRKAIDDMMDGKEFDKSLVSQVKKTANRGFIPGFLYGFPGKGDDVYYDENAPLQTHKFMGVVRKVEVNGEKDLYEVDIRNRLEKGSVVEVMTSEDEFEVEVSEMFDLQGESVDAVHGGAGNKLLRLREGIPVEAMVRVQI
ncbi:U32 family peptidase [Candidatus Peregrinibacteria bacterium]|jgi:U32 family peptidase|nr:U32 family peptidase [Candidatus Peregrinibacteria bacterium]MBT7736685.1 U32 family peptidase [Candidatus Peregrinibacteria bacterium]